MINRFEQFTSMIFAIYRDIQKLEREEMERYGLRGAYAQYLLAMDRCEQGITAVQLCEICDKDKGAVSRALAEMQEKGLVARCGQGLYRAQLKLTEKGREAACFVRQRASIAVELAGEGLSDENRTVFYGALERIASNLQKICKEGIPDGEIQE